MELLPFSLLEKRSASLVVSSYQPFPPLDGMNVWLIVAFQVPCGSRLLQPQHTRYMTNRLFESDDSSTVKSKRSNDWCESPEMEVIENFSFPIASDGACSPLHHRLEGATATTKWNKVHFQDQQHKTHHQKGRLCPLEHNYAHGQNLHKSLLPLFANGQNNVQCT